MGFSQRCFAVLFLLTACGEEEGRHDPNASIVLSPAADIEGRHREAVRFAVESWNLELGTELSVADRPDDGGDGQSVPIAWWEGECVKDDGVEFAGIAYSQPPKIYMCPKHTLDQPAQFFETMRHEIGHVLGLQHGVDDFAIMGVQQDENHFPSRQRFFRPEDRREFARVNPDFNRAPSLKLVTGGLTRGTMVRSFDGVPHAFWDQDGSLMFAPIDPLTGARAAEPVAVVATSTTVYELMAHATDGGFELTWSQLDGLYRASVALDGAPATSTRLPIQWNRNEMYLSSKVIVGSSPYLSLTEIANRRTHLFALDEEGKVVSTDSVADRGTLVSSGGELYLIASLDSAPAQRTPYVSKLGVEWELEDRLELAETVEFMPDFERFYERVGAASIDGALVVIVTHDDRTTLTRVSTSGRLTATAHVDLGEVLWDVSILDAGSELLVAGWRAPAELYRAELFFASFDRDNLERTTEWTRASAIDQLSGTAPFLQLSGDRLLLSWLEALGDMRARVMPLE
jgi:hypothetical protein